MRGFQVLLGGSRTPSVRVFRGTFAQSFRKPRIGIMISRGWEITFPAFVDMSKQPDQNKVIFPRGVDFIDLPLHADDRGQLTVAENSSLPFEARRVFWLTGVPEAAERGGHAHSTCAEVLYAVSGAVKIDLSDGTRDLTVELSLPNRGIVIPPMVWCRLYDFSPNFVGLCFASEAYRPEGYFRSWEEFRKNAI